MPIIRTDSLALEPVVSGWESMLSLIQEAGIIPFFSNPLRGWSIEEHTPLHFWFTDEQLGPWDWKIECVRSGDIAYGKYLWGGKASFARADVYRELVNWRRSLPKYAPTAEQQKVLDYVEEHGSVSVPEVRALLGLRKSAADALLARLQMQTRLVTGDIERVYRGPDLRYSGWQRSSFCTPDALFEAPDFPFPGFGGAAASDLGLDKSFKSALTPKESLEFLKETVRKASGVDVPDALWTKMLG